MANGWRGLFPWWPRGGRWPGSLARALFAIWFTMTLCFFLFRLLPAETPLRESRSLPQQYFAYLGQLARGDFGLSLASRGVPVGRLIAAVLPWTLFTVGSGLTLSFALGVVLGTLAGYWRGETFDTVFSAFAALTLGVPQSILGTLLVVYGGVRWGLFDLSAQRGALSPGVEPDLSVTFLADVLAHAWLPILAYVLMTVGYWFLLMKNATTAVLEEDYVAQGRARGLTDERLALAYVGRNAVLPVTTFGAIALGNALGGSVIFEQIFVYRGIGFLLTESVNRRDLPVLQAGFLLLTTAIILSNLATELLYPWLDPRVRAGERVS